MRTVVDPAGRPGMAIGVDPASRSLTNTRAPAGRDCTLSPPAVARHHPSLGGQPAVCVCVPAGRRRVIVIDDVGRRASVAASVPLPRTRHALHEWYTIRAPVRAAPPEFFPAAFHSPAHRHQRASIESTCCLSARAQPRPTRDAMALERGGVFRCVQRVQRVRVAAGLPAEAPGAAGAEPGRSTIVASTPAGVSVTDPAARQRKNHPTDSAAMIATARTATAIGHFLRPVSGSAASAASSSCDGCVDHGRFRGRGGD